MIAFENDVCTPTPWLTLLLVLVKNFVLTKLEVLNLTKINITFSRNANFLVRAK